MEISNELLLACKKQDRKHQKVLFDLLFPYLKNLCYRYLNFRDDVDDAVQISFILIFKNIEQYNPDLGTFQSWASKIAIHSSLKLNRKNNVHQFDDKSIKHLPVQAEAIASMNLEHLLALLDRIGSDYKTVFLMVVVDGFGYDEIAQTLQISEDNVRKRLSRARHKLQELIKIQEEELTHHHKDVKT